MERQTMTVSRRKKTALLVAPFVVLPLLTLGFRALEGGSGPAGGPGEEAAGLNARLPRPHLEAEEGSKLSFYEVARGDSQKKRASVRQDAYLRGRLPADTPFIGGEEPLLFPAQGGAAGTDPEAAAEKVYRQLSELQGQLSGRVPQQKASALPPPPPTGPGVHRTGAQQLEGMLQRLNGASGRDPELEQLNGLMEKILDIQHPGRVAGRLAEGAAAPKEGVRAISTSPVPATVSCLDTAAAEPGGGQSFYGTTLPGLQDQPGSLPAVIHAGGEVRDGSLVALRLLTEVWTGGVRLPQNHLVYGTATLRGGRLQVRVSSVRYRDQLLAVDLEAYDKDGQPGLAVPGAADRQAAQNALAGVTQSLDLASVDPSLRGQVAGAGAQAVKSMLGKKVRPPRVRLPAGYRLLLRDRSNP